jgi:hypothetical protein
MAVVAAVMDAVELTSMWWLQQMIAIGYAERSVADQRQREAKGTKLMGYLTELPAIAECRRYRMGRGQRLRGEG